MASDVPPVDYETITARQRATWAEGDFNAIARKVMPMSEALCEAAGLHARQRVLDVACGTGNAALVAARRDCEVTGLDYVPDLIERAKMRADAEGSVVEFRVGDAQSLPFPDASFDAVISAIGVMFAPDQARAAQELLRVCRPGGKIALASWTPERFGGDFFGAHGRFAPPPPGLASPTRWGTEEGLDELLGVGTQTITHERRQVFLYYPSVEDAVEFHRTYFGPTIRAFEATEPAQHDNVRQAIGDVFKKYNRADDGTVALECEYLLSVASRA